MRDVRVRSAAFRWLSEQVERYGDVLPRTVLEEGFVLDGERIPLVGPQGIFKPRVLSDLPLSITTAPNSQYPDILEADGLLRYRYRGTDPDHPDNRRLRLAWRQETPLIYFLGIVPGKYLAVWPVYIVGDDPANLCVLVAVDSHQWAGSSGEGRAEAGDNLYDQVRELRRRYATAEVRVRLHQRLFRERVLEAYRRQCAFCRFRHEELLDAAHIIPDTHPHGEPVVSNGLALCTFHHRAFDRNFIGVSPDYVIQVRPDILEEEDGPTLVHGLQRLHGRTMVLPHSRQLRPNRDLLALRYERFREAI